MVHEFAEQEVAHFLSQVNDKYGYDFTSYAKASLLRRISRFMIQRAIPSIGLLTKAVMEESVFDAFLAELTVNVTEMFRDPTFYKALRSVVVPQLKTYPFIRIWDAGCSTGEETYSLAILLKEESAYQKTKIYATDINQKVLARALEGIYPIHYMKGYSRNYLHAGGKTSLSDYYHAKYNSAIMNESLKNNFVVSAHNLVSDGPFNEFNMIVCRNVLIYFQKELQEKVIELFLNSLPMFGYLALGSKESLAVSRFRKHFEVVDTKEKIYRRIA